MVERIILLNGPPSCGKDTIAEVMQHYVVKFATPLKDTVCQLYCGGDRDLFDKYDKDAKYKNEPSGQFFGLSCREAQINVSEKFMKPIHGKRVFGDILARALEGHEGDFFVVSDSGFIEEAMALVEKFGPNKVMLIRLHRDGCNYDGDSRSYIEWPENYSESLYQADVYNNGTIQETLAVIKEHIKIWECLNTINELQHQQLASQKVS